MLFSIDEVFTAYKKMKHYFYHDNTSLFIRKKIALFEQEIVTENGSDDDDFRRKMRQLARKFSALSLKEWRQEVHEDITFKVTPKSFKKRQSTIITNYSNEENPHLNRVNIFIDATVEMQLVSVLWLMKIGHLLSKDIEPENYAYKLELYHEDEDDEEFRPVVGGLKLFQPYYIQYQKWRDLAIQQVESLLENRKNAVLLSLDIKDYFHSVKVNLQQLRDDILENNDFESNQEKQQITRLFDLLNIIHDEYTEKLQAVKNLPDLEDEESILPIGLLSSGLIGNYYLKDLDTDIKDKLNPAYYGRYVDDLLFVFSNVKVDHQAVYPVNDFLTKYFVERGIFKFDNLNELLKGGDFKPASNPQTGQSFSNPNVNEITDQKLSELILRAKELKFALVRKPDLLIQSNKVILQYFDFKESSAILNKFKKNLEKNRSEYRFLPDEDEVDSEFDEEAFSMHYNDSVNKLRSIKEFSEDKYGASKYLANKIFASSFSDEKPDKKTNKQILTFFKGEVGLAFHTLWEKVATYFILNEQPRELARFFRQTARLIETIDIVHYEDTDQRRRAKIITLVKRHLYEHLEASLATPLALNPNFLSTKWQKDLEGEFEFEYLTIRSLAIQIRSANMFRHFLLPISALNFSKYASTTDKSLIKFDLEEISKEQYGLDNRLKLLAPRHVSFHEINILEIYKTISGIYNIETAKEINGILNRAFSDYWEINNHWKYLKDTADYAESIKNKQKYYFLATNEIDQIESAGWEDTTKLINKAYFINVKDTFNRSEINKKIAIANIRLEANDVRRSILGNPNTSRERRQRLFKLINQVEKEKCDLFVLPETSVPYRWINLLAYQSQRRNLAIIAGLEHWVNKRNFAFNFVITILPIEKKNYRTCLIKIRLKNFYSHEEKHVLKGYRLIIPSETTEKELKQYDLFHWKNVYFSVYNCFELANIEDRGLFKGKVDFIVASEFNQDTNYFADIGGSWVRDIHSFFIQVNSSEFGDSTIIQPSKSATKHILQIKGGANPTILVETIKIKELRDFQLKEYHLQKDDIQKGITEFKPTPPDFNPEDVKKRIKNKS